MESAAFSGHPDRGDAGPLRVVIADDDADTCDSMALLLGLWGFEVIAVRGGPEALEAIQTHRPDVVLLDLAMPKMDGLEVARRVRQQPGQRPLIVAVSGHADARMRQRSAEAGIDLHLAKPADLAHLEHLLRALQRTVTASAQRRQERPRNDSASWCLMRADQPDPGRD